MPARRVSRIDMPSPSQLEPGPHRIMLAEVHELYRNAGCPSTRKISATVDRMDSARDVISHQAVANILNGTNFPAWAKMEVLTSALLFFGNCQATELELERIRKLWLAAHYEDEGSAPPVGIVTDSSNSAVLPTRPEAPADAAPPPNSHPSPNPDPESSSRTDTNLQEEKVTSSPENVPLSGEGGETEFEEMRVRFISGSWDGPAMFSIDLMAGMLQIIVNDRHPLGASMARTIMGADDEAARLLKMLLVSWARMEDEIPSNRLRNRVADIRQDWGRYAKWLEEPTDQFSTSTDIT